MRWLTADEKKTTHLVTAWIDDRSPMISGSISNGLTGVATDAAPSATPVFTAHGEWPFALPVNERTVWLDADFVYRRGGGVIETDLRTRHEGPAAKAVEPGDALSRKFSIELIPSGDEFPAVKTADDEPWRAVMPRAAFCALVGDGRILIGPSEGLGDENRRRRRRRQSRSAADRDRRGESRGHVRAARGGLPAADKAGAGAASPAFAGEKGAGLGHLPHPQSQIAS